MLTGFAIACFSVSAAESELPTLCQRSDKHGQNYLRLQDAKLLNRQTASGRSLSAVELLPEVVWSQRNAFPPRHVRPDIQAVQEQLPSIARQDRSCLAIKGNCPFGNTLVIHSYWPDIQAAQEQLPLIACKFLIKLRVLGNKLAWDIPLTCLRDDR